MKIVYIFRKCVIAQKQIVANLEKQYLRNGYPQHMIRGQIKKRHR